MAYLAGSRCSNRGSLARYLKHGFVHVVFRHGEQEAIQVHGECEVADEPVVVMKSRPEKAGNRVEDKTRTTVAGDATGLRLSKGVAKCEGVK